MGEITADISRNIEGTVSGMVSSVRGMLSEISQAIASTKAAAASVSVGSSGKSYSAMPRAMRLARSIQMPSVPYIHSAIEKLSHVDIPGYATGQVIPTTMKRHLAWLGDNPRETEVVSPLSTIKQAQKESLLEVLSELGLTGGRMGNDRPIIAKLYLDGHQVTEAVIKDGMVRQMSTGNNPFSLGTT